MYRLLWIGSMIICGIVHAEIVSISYQPQSEAALIEEMNSPNIQITGDNITRTNSEITVETASKAQIDFTGEYSASDMVISFDYYITPNSSPRRLRLGSGLARFLEKGKWVHATFPLYEFWGGDFWRLQNNNKIERLSLLFEGPMVLKIKNLKIAKKSRMPYGKPEVLSISPTGKIALERTFPLGSTASQGWLQIISTAKFNCFINGKFVTSGKFNNVDSERWPIADRFYPLAQEADWSCLMQKGRENTIRIEFVDYDKKTQEIAVAIGWNEADMRNVLFSDSQWRISGGEMNSLGVIPTKKSKNFKKIVDIYPLLIPHVWNEQQYQISNLEKVSKWVPENPIMLPRILPGRWDTMLKNGRWYLKDPSGNPFFLLGTQTCQILNYWGFRFAKHSYNAFSSYEDWVRHYYAMMRRIGFNTLTVNMPEGFFRLAKYDGVPAFRYCSTKGKGEKLKTYDGKILQFQDPFDPAWRNALDQRIQNLAERFNGDPSVIGFFMDNELPIDGSLHGRSITGAVYSKFAGKEFIDFLRKRYKLIDALNLAWYQNNSKQYHSSFEDILKDRPDPWSGEKKYPKGFICHDYPIIDSYSKRWRDFHDFAVYTTKVFAGEILQRMRKELPDKLVGTNRFMGGCLDEMLDAYQDYDIIAWNAYPMEMWNKGTFSPRQIERMRRAHQRIGKPIIITEFNMQALDTDTNSTSANLKDQKQRGEEFAKLIEQIGKELPCVAGIVHFSWMDSSENEKSNFGIVNGSGQPYLEFIKGMQQGFELLDKKILR